MELDIRIESFTGFYSGMWSHDYFYENGITDVTETYGDLEYKYDWTIQDIDQWHSDFAKAYADAFYSLIEEYLGIQFKVKSVSVWSPKAYNYATDEIDSVVEAEDGWREKLVALMDKHKDKLSTYIKDNHTSCDGFWSFMENRFDDWRSIISQDPDYVSHKQECHDMSDMLYISYALLYLLLIVGDMSNVRVQELIASDMEGEYDIWYPQMEPDTDRAKEEWERVKAKHDRLAAQPCLPGLEDYC